MMYNTKEWLSIPKEEKLMMIRMTVAENADRLYRKKHGVQSGPLFV